MPADRLNFRQVLALASCAVCLCCCTLLIAPFWLFGGSSLEIRVTAGDEMLIFRKIAPRREQLNYPDFYMLETEVTNRMYREFLRATGHHKDDREVLAIVEKRDKLGGGTTADIPYSIEKKSAIWISDDYPAGRDEYPVAVLTVPDAEDFCVWLNQLHPELGTFRLPTWNEWMIAAYGRNRSYPWGNKWEPGNCHTAFRSIGTPKLTGPEPPIEFFTDWSARIKADPREEVKFLEAVAKFLEDHTIVGDSEPVKARPNGRTPEGLYGMIGNVQEYLVREDPRGADYFNLGSSWMGGDFTTGDDFWRKPRNVLEPRTDYWGYSHHYDLQEDTYGFRVLLDPTNDRSLLTRDRVFEQKYNGWRIK